MPSEGRERRREGEKEEVRERKWSHFPKEESREKSDLCVSTARLAVEGGAAVHAAEAYARMSCPYMGLVCMRVAGHCCAHFSAEAAIWLSQTIGLRGVAPGGDTFARKSLWIGSMVWNVTCDTAALASRSSVQATATAMVVRKKQAKKM